MINLEKNKFLIIGYNVKSDWVNINSDDFCLTYGNGLGGHGCQCAYNGDTKEAEEIQNILDNISDEIRKLYKLNVLNMQDKKL